MSFNFMSYIPDLLSNLQSNAILPILRDQVWCGLWRRYSLPLIGYLDLSILSALNNHLFVSNFLERFKLPVGGVVFPIRMQEQKVM